MPRRRNGDRPVPLRWVRLAAIGWWLGLALTGVRAQNTPELRGWWADTFHAGMRTPAEVEALVADARAANFNALFVEVRKRGDAYYESRFEPKASDVQSGFDPLAYLIARARDTNAGARLEVHAWIVTYNIWNHEINLPPQPDHPYRLHPDWLTESFDGETWDGASYAFDPGHPAVLEHTFNVAMDLVSRYDVDGLHFDYIRYAGREWGYNPVAVARFNATTGGSGNPAPDDSGWMRWRRDQVTGLVRRVYFAAAGLKPEVKISAATITWTPTATSFATWLKAAAWSDVLQDWRGWMEEGILDINIPMAYFRHESHATAWAEWSRYAKANRFKRSVALGVGGYLNTISNTVVQMRSTRVVVGPGFPNADGVLVYSYAVPAKDGVPRSDFITALTSPSPFASGTPLFQRAVALPAAPWKTNRTTLGIGGTVTDGLTGEPIEGAQVELCGNLPQVLTTDVNGAFSGFVKYAPGNLVVSAAGYATQFHPVAADWQRIVAASFVLQPDTADLRALDLRVTPGRQSAVVSWRTPIPCRGRVIYGLGALCGLGGEGRDIRTDTRHSVFLKGLSGGGTEDPTEYWVRVVSELSGTGTNYSHAVRMVPALWPPHAGQWEVRLTGNWDFVPRFPGVESRATEGFWRTAMSSGSPTAAAVWSAPIEVTGNYDVEYGLSGNGSAAGWTYEIVTPRTNLTVTVRQTGPSGRLATNLFLLRGERPEIRLANRGTSGGFVIADWMSWRYREGQDPAPAGTVPAWWAGHFFGGSADPLADADGDGYSNEAEYAFGTDPTNAESFLRLRLEPADAGGWQIVFWPRAGGRVPVIERTSDLGATAWETLPIEWPWPEATPAGEWIVPVLPTDANRQFYRFTVKPQ